MEKLFISVTLCGLTALLIALSTLAVVQQKKQSKQKHIAKRTYPAELDFLLEPDVELTFSRN